MHLIHAGIPIAPPHIAHPPISWHNDSKWALIVISSDILSKFSQKVDQKWKMVKSEVGSNFAQNDSKWAHYSHIKSYFVLFQPKSWPKVENSQKWSWFKLCSKYLQMGPNNHIKSYFGPFQPKSWPKVENGQKWSQFELCSKWLQIGPNSRIKS